MRAELFKRNKRISALEDQLARAGAVGASSSNASAIDEFKTRINRLTEEVGTLQRQIRAKDAELQAANRVPAAASGVAQAPSASIAPGQNMVVDSLRSTIAQLERQIAAKDEVIAEHSARYRALLARAELSGQTRPQSRYESRYSHSVSEPRPLSSSSDDSSSSDSDDEPSSSSRRSGTSSSTPSVGGLGIRRLPIKHVPPVLKTSAQTRRAAVALAMKNKQAVAANTRSRAASNYEREEDEAETEGNVFFDRPNLRLPYKERLRGFWSDVIAVAPLEVQLKTDWPSVQLEEDWPKQDRLYHLVRWVGSLHNTREGEAVGIDRIKYKWGF